MTDKETDSCTDSAVIETSNTRTNLSTHQPINLFKESSHPADRRRPTEPALEQNIQTAAARKRRKNTRADAAATTTTSPPVILIIPLLLLRWVSLGRVVHGLLILRRRRSVVSLGLRRPVAALLRVSALVIVVVLAAGRRRAGVIGASIVDGRRIRRGRAVWFAVRHVGV